LTIRDSCYDSVAALTVGVDDATYEVDDDNSGGDTMTPTFTPALADSCDYTLTIKYKLSTQADDQYALISTTTFLTNPSGFIVNVLETDYASYADPIVYDIWWNYVITDTSLSALETEANEYAQLTMVDTCYDNAWTVVTPTSDVTF
jgi:hypothetical protein